MSSNRAIVFLSNIIQNIYNLHRKFLGRDCLSTNNNYRKPGETIYYHTQGYIMYINSIDLLKVDNNHLYVKLLSLRQKLSQEVPKQYELSTKRTYLFNKIEYLSLSPSFKIFKNYKTLTKSKDNL